MYSNSPLAQGISAKALRSWIERTLPLLENTQCLRSSGISKLKMLAQQPSTHILNYEKKISFGMANDGFIYYGDSPVENIRSCKWSALRGLLSSLKTMTLRSSFQNWP